MAVWTWPTNNADLTYSEWSFVIDTDRYAGNFERELCSYVCGQSDELEAGCRSEQYLDLYHHELPQDPFQDLIDLRIDDHGDDMVAHAPMALAPTPGMVNIRGREVRLNTLTQEQKDGEHFPAFCSVAIFLKRKPTDEELKLLVWRAQEFQFLSKQYNWEVRPVITGYRLVEEKTVLVSTRVEV